MATVGQALARAICATNGSDFNILKRGGVVQPSALAHAVIMPPWSLTFAAELQTARKNLHESALKEFAVHFFVSSPRRGEGGRAQRGGGALDVPQASAVRCRTLRHVAKRRRATSPRRGEKTDRAGLTPSRSRRPIRRPAPWPRPAASAGRSGPNWPGSWGWRVRHSPARAAHRGSIRRRRASSARPRSSP